MKKKGFVATLVFGIACFWGVVAMFSQADFRTREPARLRSMDVSPAKQGVFGHTLPQAIQRAALHEQSDDVESPDGKARGKRLTLR